MTKCPTHDGIYHVRLFGRIWTKMLMTSTTRHRWFVQVKCEYEGPKQPCSNDHSWLGCGCEYHRTC